MSQIAELTLREEGDVVVAAVTGELDMSNTSEIGRRVLVAVPNTALGLVLDLRGTTYLDSTGVKLVFELAERLVARQQALCLVVGEEGVVRRVLQLTGAEGKISDFTTVERAMQQVKALAPARTDDELSDLLEGHGTQG